MTTDPGLAGTRGAYHLSALCETCGVSRAGLLIGDPGEDISELVQALHQGWQRLHAGHLCGTTAMYARVDVSQVDFVDWGEAPEHARAVDS